MRTIDWLDGAIVLVDQSQLPDATVALRIDAVDELVDSIARLAVRGAPALGVAGAYGVALALLEHGVGPAYEAALAQLRGARPTAVNLARMVDRVAAAAHAAEAGDPVTAALEEADRIRDEEVAASWAMGQRGAELMEELVDRPVVAVMTICNTGGLAAVERGTALAVAFTLHDRGRLTEVLALETRPLLQGARLTAWELARASVPHRVIVDGAAASLLARGQADVVLIGADRIAANGDTANKVGSYALALAARAAGVPFVVVAPESTVDADTATGDDIEIEERDPGEVTHVRGVALAPTGTGAANPAFDITPAALITAIVTDRRVVRLDRGATL